MLGCQDFCGYYEWTFHFLRRKFGQEGIERYWREAIAADAQSHYIAAGKQSALRGLYDCWSHTGDSEQCDWTVSLDEANNHLRLDMRECPSKGFLLTNNLNADEDYCDHCIGWIGPALKVLNAEVVAHEHNHCGQCWWQIAMKDRPSAAAVPDADIRDDPRWQHGYLDRFEHHELAGADLSDDPRSTFSNQAMFTDDRPILVLGDDFAPDVRSDNTELIPYSVVTDRAYLKLDSNGPEPRCIVLGYDLFTLEQVAKRWLAKAHADRPTLLHSFLPAIAPISFLTLGLPRPRPILPILIQEGLYVHDPAGTPPSTGTLVVLLAKALAKDFVVVGIAAQELGLARLRTEG